MSDLISTGIIGFAAYLGGIVTKPVQDWINERRECYRLRRAIYREIAGIINQIQRTLNCVENNKNTLYWLERFIEGLNFECYEQASKNPILLTGVKEIRGITLFYEEVKTYRKDHEEIKLLKDFDWTKGLRIIAGGIRLFIRDKMLNKRLLLKYVNPAGMTFINSIDYDAAKVKHND
jgi:hypothetical protein